MTKSEGAPKMETPEKKTEEPSEETPRDEEAPLETPEDPRVETRMMPRLEFDKVVADVLRKALPLPAPAPVPPPLKPSKSTPTTPVSADIAELFRHVADNPVDSHAPVWVAHPANTGGTPQ